MFAGTDASAIASANSSHLNTTGYQFPGELSPTEGSSPRTHGFSTSVLLHVGPYHAGQRRPGSGDEAAADESPIRAHDQPSLKLFIENQYHCRERDRNEHGNDGDQDGVRADIDSADASQDTIDKGKERPSAGAPRLRRGKLSRLRRGGNRNGIVHDDPFDQGAHDYRANISLVGRGATSRMLYDQIDSGKYFQNDVESPTWQNQSCTRLGS